MNYGAILQRAWQIIWKHKILWIFGIFAGCSSGGFGGGGGNYGSSSTTPSDFTLPDQITNFFDQIFSRFEEWQIIALIVLLVLGVLLFFFLLTILFIFLGTIGRIGIILGAHWVEEAANSSNEQPKINFGRLFRAGLPYFWRLFFLNLLLSLGWLIGIFIGAVILILSIVGICFLLPYCCLLIPLGWAFNIYVQQTNVALITENLSLGQALQRGWEVFKTHLGELLVMGFILAVGGIIISIAIVIPLFFAFVPLFIAMVLNSAHFSITAGLIISAILLVIYFPILLLLNGGLQAYLQTAWTLTYRHLAQERIEGTIQN